MKRGPVKGPKKNGATSTGRSTAGIVSWLKEGFVFVAVPSGVGIMKVPGMYLKTVHKGSRVVGKTRRNTSQGWSYVEVSDLHGSFRNSMSESLRRRSEVCVPIVWLAVVYLCNRVR